MFDKQIPSVYVETSYEHFPWTGFQKELTKVNGLSFGPVERRLIEHLSSEFFYCVRLGESQVVTILQATTVPHR